MNETDGLTTNEMKEFLYKPCLKRDSSMLILLGVIDNHPVCNIQDQGILWDLGVDGSS